MIQGTDGGPGSTQAFDEPEEEEIEEHIEEEIPAGGAGRIYCWLIIFVVVSSSSYLQLERYYVIIL